MTRASARAVWLVAALLAARASLDSSADAKPANRAAPPAGAARLLHGEPLDVNREPAEVLALLPGVGPARAQAIVGARPVCSLADLDRIPGIGPATLLRLQPNVAFRAAPHDCEPELRPESH